MISVVFHHTTVENHLHQWEFVLSHFRPDAIYCVIGDGERSHLDGSVLSQARLIRDSGDVVDDPLVLMAPVTGTYIAGEMSLADFEHPDDAVYWLGSDAAHLDPALFERRSPDHVVQIPTDTRDQMFSHVAYAVTMWDRRLKIGAR